MKNSLFAYPVPFTSSICSLSSVRAFWVVEEIGQVLDSHLCSSRLSAVGQRGTGCRGLSNLASDYKVSRLMPPDFRPPFGRGSKNLDDRIDKSMWLPSLCLVGHSS